MSKIADGSYMARAVSIESMKSAPPKNTPGVTVTFKILDKGPHEGQLIEWNGWTSPNARERTAAQLALCGFDGVDPKSVCKDTVQIVVEEETYVTDEGTPEQKVHKRPRVQWINDPTRGRTQFKPMDAAERQEQFAGLRGLLVAERKKVEEARAKAPADAGKSAGSFDFGANAQPPAAPPQNASQPDKKAMF